MREMWCPTCDLTLPAPGGRCPSCGTEQEKPASYWIRVFLAALVQVGLPIAVGVGLESHVLAAGVALGIAVSAILWSLLWAAGTPQY